jgi:hypothetical protein
MNLFYKLVRLAPLTVSALACGSDPTVSVNLVININSGSSLGQDAGAGQGAAGNASGGISSSDGGTSDGPIANPCTNDASCNGMVLVEASFEHCPEILNLSITQPDARTTVILVTATDKDGDRLSYSWTAASGRLSDPSSLQTSYTCAADGTHVQTVTVQVSDGQCADRRDITVTCP